MENRNKTFSVFTIVLATAAMFLNTSCIQERPEVNAQGQNIDNLIEKKSVDNLKCTLTTGTKKEKVKEILNSDANELIIDSKEIKFLDALKYTTDCPYISDKVAEIEFRGEAKTTYKVVYKVEPKNVVAYKILKKDELAHYEKPYAKEEGDTYLVPFAYAPVNGFFNVEKIRDADQRETNENRRVSVDIWENAQAEFIHFDENGFDRFDSIDKKDIYPKSYFSGEWYMGETTTEKRVGGRGMLGYTGSFASDHSGRRVEANKVKFLVKEDAIHVVNISIDEEVQAAGNDLNLLTALKIPVNLKDFERDMDGKYETSREVEISDIDQSKKKYVQIDFKGMQSSGSIAGLGLLGRVFSAVSRVNSFKNIKDLEMSEKYFSFSVEDGETGKIVRYSFKKAEETGYKPKQAHTSDMIKFGFFKLTKDKVRDETLIRKEDFDKLRLIQRHNPEKDIVYRFSKATSKEKWVRDMGREAVNIWNQAFKKAGFPNEVVLDESSDVELGDIRYNVINIVLDDVSQQGSGGVGPSSADPFTGEIVASTANTYIWSPGYYRILRDYVSTQIGYMYKFQDFQSTAPDKRLLRDREEAKNKFYFVMNNNYVESDDEGNVNVKSLYQWQKGSEQSKLILAPAMSKAELNEAAVGMGYHLEAGDTFGDVYQEIRALEADTQESALNVHQFEGAAENPVSSYKEMDAFVAKHCPQVTKFIQEYKTKAILPSTLSENMHIADCAKKHMTYHRFSTVVHEMGHTLGLRHNFMGSYDSDHHSTKGSFEYKYLDVEDHMTADHWTSVMDYASYSTPGLRLSPGKYDIAALRFGYMDEIEVLNPNRFVKVPSNISIDDFLSSKSLERKEYMYCTDWHARTANTNVFCNLVDQGTTAVGLVKRIIDEMYTSVSRYTLRYDRLSAIGAIGGQEALNKMKGFYEHWRGLVLNEVGIERKYLQGMTYGEYLQVVEKMTSDAHPNAEENRDFLEARNLIFETLMDLMFIPNKYCMVKDAAGKESLIELDTIKFELSTRKINETVSSCSAPIVEKHFKDLGVSLIEEVGHYLEGGRYSLDVNYISTSPLDYSGIAPLRLNAARSLMGRDVVNFSNAMSGFAPSMLDEPDLMTMVTESLLPRIVEGLSLPKAEARRDVGPALYKPEDLERRVDRDALFVKYKEEAGPLLSRFYQLYYAGLGIPGDSSLSNERRAPMSSSRTNNPSQLDPSVYNIYQVSSTQFKFWGKDAHINNAISGEIERIEEILTNDQVFSGMSMELIDATLVNTGNVVKGFLELDKVLIKHIIELSTQINLVLQGDTISPSQKVILSKTMEPLSAVVNVMQQQIIQGSRIQDPAQQRQFMSALSALALGRTEEVPPTVMDMAQEILSQDATEGIKQAAPMFLSADAFKAYATDVVGKSLKEEKLKSESLKSDIEELKAKRSFLIEIL